MPDSLAEQHPTDYEVTVNYLLEEFAGNEALVRACCRGACIKRLGVWHKRRYNPGAVSLIPQHLVAQRTAVMRNLGVKIPASSGHEENFSCVWISHGGSRRKGANVNVISLG